MFRLGIDLGGTNIVAAVVDDGFKIISAAKQKTKAPDSPENIAERIYETSLEAIEKSGVKKEEIKSVGIGTPGAVDSQSGIVVFSSNLGFNNVDLRKMLSEKFGKPVYIENDANAAAYGEFIAGAGKGSRDFIAVTVGTGIGGGIIADGKIYSGFNGAGGEIGHMVIEKNGIECACGRKGCFEAYASASALVRQTKSAMEKDRNSLMWSLCDGELDMVNGCTAFDGMRKGDITAKNTVDEYICYLSAGIINMINIFQPEILCIGGGISHEGETLIAPIREKVNSEEYFRNGKKRTVIKTAQLEGDAGVIGAAFLDKVKKGE